MFKHLEDYFDGKVALRISTNKELEDFKTIFVSKEDSYMLVRDAAHEFPIIAFTGDDIENVPTIPFDQFTGNKKLIGYKPNASTTGEYAVSNNTVYKVNPETNSLVLFEIPETALDKNFWIPQYVKGDILFELQSGVVVEVTKHNVVFAGDKKGFETSHFKYIHHLPPMIKSTDILTVHGRVITLKEMIQILVIQQYI